MAGKPKRRKAQPAIVIAEPTPEQIDKGDFRRIGMSYRRTPVIETLYAEHKLNQREYEVLDYYGSQASLADHSPTRSCIDFSPRGGGDGPGVGILSAKRETYRLERDMGSLADIARAVVVDNLTLEQWCISRAGSIESERGKGKVVVMVPRGAQFQIRMALLELRMAARRIMGV